CLGLLHSSFQVIFSVRQPFFNGSHGLVEILHHDAVAFHPLGQMIICRIIHVHFSFLYSHFDLCPVFSPIRPSFSQVESHLREKTVTHLVCNGFLLPLLRQRHFLQI